MSIPVCITKKALQKRKWESTESFQTNRKLKNKKVKHLELCDELLSQLPEELQLRIFGFLKWPYEAMVAREACRRWRRIIPFDLKKIQEIDWTQKPMLVQCTKHNHACHDYRFDMVNGGFLLHHIIHDNINILTRYFDTRIILPKVLHMLGNKIPVEYFSLPTINWLYFQKGMFITKHTARCIVKRGAPEVARWLCTSVRVKLVYTTEDPKAISTIYKVYCGLKWAIQSGNTQLWDFVWRWLWSGSSLILENTKIQEDANQKKIFWNLTKHALKHGFSPAARKLVPIISRRDGSRIRNPADPCLTVSPELAFLMGMISGSGLWIHATMDLVERAIIGNDMTCLELMESMIEANNLEKKMKKHAARFVNLAIRCNSRVSYDWLVTKIYPDDVLSHETWHPHPYTVLELVNTYGAEPKSLMATLLSDWKSLIQVYNNSSGTYQWANIPMKTTIARHGLWEILSVFHEKQCLFFDREDMVMAKTHLLRGWTVHADVGAYKKTLHIMASSYGLKEPDTWDLNKDFDTWK